jgi:hypothetical protein
MRVHPGIPGIAPVARSREQLLITDYAEKAGLPGSLLVAVGFLAARSAGATT